jgi:hypothetical protein
VENVSAAMDDYETTFPLLTQLSELERDALKRFIAEERPDLSESQAARVLISEALKGMGLLAVR